MTAAVLLGSDWRSIGDSGPRADRTAANVGAALQYHETLLGPHGGRGVGVGARLAIVYCSRLATVSFRGVGDGDAWGERLVLVGSGRLRGCSRRPPPDGQTRPVIRQCRRDRRPEASGVETPALLTA